MQYSYVGLQSRMKKLLVIVVLSLFWFNPVFANIYLFELGLGGAGSGIGGVFIFLLILYGAFFGSKITKAIIWGWVMFFVVLGYGMVFFSPIEGFMEIVIPFLAAFAVLMLFAFKAEKEQQKERDEWEVRHRYFLKKSKTKKRKRKRKK